MLANDKNDLVGHRRLWRGILEKCGGPGFATAITASTSSTAGFSKIFFGRKIESEFARHHRYGNDAD